VEAAGGESEYSGVLKTRKLLIFRSAQNAENGKIAPNWNVSGTRDFSFSQPLILRRTLTLNEILDKLGYLATARNGQTAEDPVQSHLSG
jgi:hypothetical protein